VNTLKSFVLRHSRAMRVIVCSSAALLLFVSSEAVAGGGGGHGVPWGDIFKHAFNLAILVGVIVYFTRKPFATFLQERSELIRKSIEDAATARAEAMKKLEEMDARMATLSDELAKLSSRIESESIAEAAALRDMAEAEIARIRAQAQFSSEQELKKARIELRQEASVLASEAAQELVRKSLSAQDQERLVQENIEKIERVV